MTLLAIRELIGWLLLAASLCMIGFALVNVADRRVVEAGIVVAASLIVMRAGMLLIRMSTAARICQRVAERNGQPGDR